VQSEIEHSAEVLIHEGRPYVIAISDKVKTPLPYRVDKNVLYPTAVVGERLARLEQAIGEAVLALGIRTGVAHVELATVRDGSVLFELGARCGGGGTPEPIVPFVTGIDEFLEQVRIYTGDAPTQVTPTRHRACNYHFLTPRPGRVRAIAGIDQVKRLPGILDAELLVRPGDQVKQVRVGTERAGFIIAGGKTRQEVVALADRAEALIQMEYEDGPGVPQSDPQV
jgi:biotin carboxylase